MIDVIAFDADDTLWHNETLFVMTQDKFKQLLAPYLDREYTGQELFATEMRNLRYFGYGIKGFALSMIETALELTEGRIQGSDIQQIIDYAKAMLDTPVQLLNHVAEVIPQLAATHTLMLITKGDLFDQESKIAQSGLASHFMHIEIVSDKTKAVYEALLAKYRIAPAHFIMVGNALRSDILPVVEVGAQAVYIPYHLTWAHETISVQVEQGRYIEIEHMGLLPGVVEGLSGQAPQT